MRRSDRLRLTGVHLAWVFVASVVVLACILMAGRALASDPTAGADDPNGAAKDSRASAPFDDPIADAAARHITHEQTIDLIKGIFARAASLATDKVEAVPGVKLQMPVYNGKGRDGKYHIATVGGGLACLHFAPHTEDEEADCFGAILSFAADSASATSELKGEYDRASDKHEFARVLGRALQLDNTSKETKANADIAYLRGLRIGETRTNVYAGLRSRSIVVSNEIFNPGKSLGTSGCEFESTEAAAEYPTFGESLPPQTCGSNGAPRSMKGELIVAPESPRATATFDLGFDLACGYEKFVDLNFDDRDRLHDVTVSAERHVCL